MKPIRTGGGLLAGVAGFWRASAWWLKGLVLLFIALLALSLLQSDAKDAPAATLAPIVPGPAQLSPYEQCVERGRTYFTQIGASPKLSDGRLAVDVARERCGRTLTAF
jgi:hypothetical protein